MPVYVFNVCVSVFLRDLHCPPSMADCLSVCVILRMAGPLWVHVHVHVCMCMREYSLLVVLGKMKFMPECFYMQ